LAEIASPVALSALADNPGADIPNSGFRHMLERHGSDAALRESLLNRADLPLDIWQAIAAALANHCCGNGPGRAPAPWITPPLGRA
jgi:uncharacterized protein (DUF2336 family)